MGRGYQLENYKTELRSIIRELHDLERAVRSYFKNIGNDMCADSIHSVIERYESALGTLNEVPASHIDQMIQASIDAKAALGK